MTRLAERIAAWWALAGGVAILALMLVTSVNAAGFALDKLARLAGGSVPGVSGYEDFVRLAVSCAALMFLPYCQSRKGHVAVDLFVNLLSPGMRRAIDRVWLAVTALVALFLAYWMAQGLAESRSDNTLTPVLGWPEWPFYGPGLVSLLLWALIAVAQAAEQSQVDV